MRIGELARKAGVSTKAVRYYERLGLVDPAREPNGYRSFGENDVRVVMEVRALSVIGISPSKAGPFVECLDLGHGQVPWSGVAVGSFVEGVRR